MVETKAGLEALRLAAASEMDRYPKPVGVYAVHPATGAAFPHTHVGQRAIRACCYQVAHVHEVEEVVVAAHGRAIFRIESDAAAMPRRPWAYTEGKVPQQVVGRAAEALAIAVDFLHESGVPALELFPAFAGKFNDLWRHFSCFRTDRTKPLTVPFPNLTITPADRVGPVVGLSLSSKIDSRVYRFRSPGLS